MKYEIHICEVINAETNNKEPKQSILINEDQFKVIEIFADVRKDNELKSIYRINNCEFRVVPHFDVTEDVKNWNLAGLVKANKQ